MADGCPRSSRQRGDECSQGVRVAAPAVARAERSQATIPVGISDHAGLPTDSFPRCGRDELPVAVAERNIGEQVEEAAAAEPAAVDVEEIEEEARDQTLGERHSRSPVPGDVGRAEMMFDEACVRALGGPQHRNAFEWHAGARGSDHQPGGLANLLVGIGGRHDRDRASRRATRCGGGRRCQRLEQRAGVGVRGIVAGELCDHAHVDPLAQRPHEAHGEARQFVGEVHHDVLETVRAGLRHRGRSSGEQVGLVVPVIGERLGDRGADANHVPPAR